MLQTIIRWLTPPTFPEDEDKTRSALLLNVVLNTFLITLPVLFAGVLLGGAIPRESRILFILAGAWLTIFGTRLIMLAGRVAMAGTVTVIIIFIAATLAVYNLGTIRAPATSFYLLAIVVAGLTIGRQAIAWTAGLSAITIIALLVGEKNNLLPSPTLTVSITQGITFVVVFTIIAILLFLAIKSIDEALARVRRELRERQRTEEKLRESEANYRGAIIAAGFVPYSVDYQKKHFTFMGEGVYKLTGYTAQEITPAILKESIQEEYLWGVNSSLSANEARQIILSGVPLDWRQDMLIRTKTGESRWLSDTSVEIRDDNGKAIGGIGIFQDITERKQAEAEREKLFGELAAQNAELERFNYTISHELKSPVVTIKGFVGSIEKDLQNENIEKANKDLQRIANAADKMQETLSDLLELSRIGRIINSPENVELTQLIPEVIETLDGHIQKHNITIRVFPDLPALHADRARLREVFENLVGNAAKYMGDQKNPLIEIGARQDNGEQVIYVKDNGIGIESQYHTKVFGLFEKLNQASEGTGIGLALIKRIVEVHGGRIWVESKGLGKGSTFCFTIPDGRQK